MRNTTPPVGQRERSESGIGAGLRSIFRNGAYLLGANWLATAVRAAYVVVLARALGPSDYGLISAGQALYVMMIGVSTAGAASYLSRELAAGQDRGKGDVRLSFLVQAACFPVGCAAFLLMTLPGEPDASRQLAFVLLAFAYMARGTAIWGQHVFIACEVGKYQLRITSVFRSGEFAAACLVLFLGGGLVPVVAVHLASWALEAGTALFLINRNLLATPAEPIPWRRLGTVASGLLAMSAAQAASNWLRLGPLALYPYLARGPEAVGQFALAWNASLMLAMMLATIMTTAAPVVSRAHHRGDGKDLYYLVFCIRYGILLGAAAVIAGFAAGPWLITALAGAKYEAAGGLFVATLSLLGPVAVALALDQMYFVRGRTGTSFAINVLTLAVAAGAFVLTLRAFGPVEAVLSIFATMSLMIVVKSFFLRLDKEVRLASNFLRAVASASLSVAVTWALVPISPALAFASGIAALAACALVTQTVAARELRFLRRLARR